jgi:hypothetical protein
MPSKIEERRILAEMLPEKKKWKCKHFPCLE